MAYLRYLLILFYVQLLDYTYLRVVSLCSGAEHHPICRALYRRARCRHPPPLRSISLIVAAAR